MRWVHENIAAFGKRQDLALPMLLHIDAPDAQVGTQAACFSTASQLVPPQSPRMWFQNDPKDCSQRLRSSLARLRTGTQCLCKARRQSITRPRKLQAALT